MNAAIVAWDPPDCRTSNGRITNYRVLVTSPEPWVTQNVSSVAWYTGIMVTELVPFTFHWVEVTALNTAGEGPGVEVSFTTLPSGKSFQPAFPH